MHAAPSAMEPMLPSDLDPLADLATRITKVSAKTAGQVHPQLLPALEELLRVVNSYYSNLIEGNKTHPVDIERAMRRHYAEEPAKRALQEESLAHIDVQRLIERRQRDEPDLEVTTPEFLCWIHQSFYERLPDSLRWAEHPDTEERIEVVPGALRTSGAAVGANIAPDAKALSPLLQRFHDVYRISRHHGDRRLIALAAAHHRLGWIHPFLDGNGRVMRLFTDAYFRAADIDGYGLWNISRGLARSVTEYKTRLADADVPRQGDLDGRGNLTTKGLTAFCRYFLETAVDQAEHMAELLRLDRLADRLDHYVRLRAAGLIPAPEEGATMREQVGRALKAVLLHGELQRGRVAAASGYGERAASMMIKELIQEGLLTSETPKGAVRLGFPPHIAPYLFPQLIPEYN